MRRISLAALALIVAAPPAAAESVVARRRLGNNTEGMTYAPNGRYAGHALAIDGADIIAISLRAARHDDVDDDRDEENDEQEDHDSRGGRGLHGPGWRKVFDTLKLPKEWHTPRGIVYVPTQRRFYFSSKYPNASGARLLSTDERGNPTPALTVNIGNPDTWNNWEGMEWIPANAPKHPNTIAALGHRTTDFVGHLFFIRLDGTVEEELVPDPSGVLSNYLCAVAYQAPATLLITACDEHVYAMDFAGKQLGNPNGVIDVPGLVDIESVIVPGDGRLFVNGYESGRLYGFDTGYNRSAVQDRSFVIGLGLSIGRLTWDRDGQRLLASSRVGTSLAEVGRDLRSGRRLFDLTTGGALSSPSGMDYLGGGQLVVGNRFFPRGAAIFNLADGTVSSRLEFNCCSTGDPATDPFPPGPAFQVSGIAGYDANTFLVRTGADAASLKVVTRGGAPDKTTFPNGVIPTRLPDLALSSPMKGFEVHVFDAGQGRRIFTGREIYSVDGTLLHAVDAAQLGIVDSLDSGTWIEANLFVNVDGDTSTVIVYSIP